MTLAAVVAALSVGIAAGVLSGLIGIGGGVLMVPFLYFFYAHPAWSGDPVAPEAATVVAHAAATAGIAGRLPRGALRGLGAA